MPSRTKIRVLTEMQLVKRAHTSSAARGALKRYKTIEEKGGKPVITYSEFNGYRVFDDLEIMTRLQD